MAYSLKDLAVDYLQRKVEFVEQPDQVKRLQICDGCEHKTKIGTCKLCGCVLKAKTKYTKSTCPIGKW